MNVTDRTPKSDLLQAVRATSGNVQAGSSGHPALRAAAAQAAAAESFLAAMPGETVGEMRSLAQAAAQAENRRVWAWAGAGLALVGATGALAAAGAAIPAAPLPTLVTMLAGVGCIARGGFGTDHVSAQKHRVAVLDGWVRQFNAGPPDAAVVGTARPPAPTAAPATDREALVGMLEGLDARLAEQSAHPVVSSARSLVRHDLAILAKHPQATLADMRSTAEVQDARYRRDSRRYMVGGLAAFAAGATALFSVGGPVGAVGIAGLATFFLGAGLTVKAGLTQDRHSDRALLEDTLARWEPQLDAWRRQQDAPDEVRRLAGGATPAGHIEIADEGVRIGSVFIPVTRS